MPNLLTWSEKEQIRHLNTEHPEEWTPEQLAESFPVTVPVVKVSNREDRKIIVNVSGVTIISVM